MNNEPDEVREENGWWSGYPGESLHKVIAHGELPQITDSMLRKWGINDLVEVGGLRYLLEKQKRGRCTSLGTCECFPPWRGPACQYEHASSQPAKPFRALLHYLVDDQEIDVNDLTFSLPRLWDRYNKFYDYDVVLFHDGMSAKSRARIVESSKNRVWFMYVEDFKTVSNAVTTKPKQKVELGCVGEFL